MAEGRDSIIAGFVLVKIENHRCALNKIKDALAAGTADVGGEGIALTQTEAAMIRQA